MDCMKTLLSVAVLLALLAGNLPAQQSTGASPDTLNTSTAPSSGDVTKPKHVHQKHQKHQKHPDFLSMINLTPAQKAQIAQIKTGPSSHKQQHKEIKAVLTPEQRTELKFLHKQWKTKYAPSAR